MLIKFLHFVQLQRCEVQAFIDQTYPRTCLPRLASKVYNRTFDLMGTIRQAPSKFSPSFRVKYASKSYRFRSSFGLQPDHEICRAKLRTFAGEGFLVFNGRLPQPDTGILCAARYRRCRWPNLINECDLFELHKTGKSFRKTALDIC
jgi:hypothetical protein